VYNLKLPPGARLHNVFHVGLLKRYHGAMTTGPGVLLPIHHGRACPQLIENIKGWLAHGCQELLIWGSGQSDVDATWVELKKFKKTFPSYQLEDALVVQGGEM
jgi:hypothetical protein